MTTETNHAYQNASAWMTSISDYVEAMNPETWERLEELRDERDSGDLTNEEYAEISRLAILLEGYDDADDAGEQAREEALEVQVRSGWSNSAEEFEPEDFYILLSTGGPALRIRGELDRGSPSRAWLEYQDWGTPWTEYHGPNADQSTLLQFASIFCFGE